MPINSYRDFQNYLDEVIETNVTTKEKIDLLQHHLLKYQELYERWFYEYFDLSTLENDQYFYLTFTYLDQPIDMEAEEFFVASMIGDQDEFHYELSIFNYPILGHEEVLYFGSSKHLMN